MKETNNPTTELLVIRNIESMLLGMWLHVLLLIKAPTCIDPTLGKCLHAFPKEHIFFVDF
jgi:hypothetical protein